MSHEPAIEDYGVVGDLNTVALVGRNGSVDFMGFPRFDSPTVFARLLDPGAGHFSIHPVLDSERQRQIYLPDSNVLLTRFLSHGGVVEVSDFMPVLEAGHSHALVRRVKAVRGAARIRMECAPRFDYARAGHEAQPSGGGVVFVSKGPDRTALRLRADIPIALRDGDAIGEFTLEPGQSAGFVLEEASHGSRSPACACDFVSCAFKATVNYWRDWVGRITYRGRWREIVVRSALVLKLLTAREHGSMVAAPTFGLPEEIGGERNWDYRYTWIRDASFTLYALIRIGLTEEASAFMGWIEQRCRELSDGGSLRIMYRLDGTGGLDEQTLGHLSGYRDSKPVRIGNGARDQLQLDIYGELMDSVYLFNKYGQPIHHDLWTSLVSLVDWVCLNWRRADEGIWEVRGGRQEFLFSRLMSWVAVDRAIRLAQKRSFPAPLSRWHAVRDDIYREIFEHFWLADRQCFVQYRGATRLDASSLLMPLVKFISPTDPRWLSTLRAIGRDLVDDSLVYRYGIDKESGALDGLRGREGTFTMCSFWYVECLARSGDLDQARFLLEKVLGFANHLGLYAEELGPSGEHLGNFPQAFTHLALISAATTLDRALSWRHGTGR